MGNLRRIYIRRYHIAILTGFLTHYSHYYYNVISELRTVSRFARKACGSFFEGRACFKEKIKDFFFKTRSPQ
jgi:hypothetical protein